MSKARSKVGRLAYGGLMRALCSLALVSLTTIVPFVPSQDGLSLSIALAEKSKSKPLSRPTKRYSLPRKKKAKTYRSAASASKRLRQKVAIVQRQRYAPPRRKVATRSYSSATSYRGQHYTTARGTTVRPQVSETLEETRASTPVKTFTSGSDTLPSLEVIPTEIRKDKVTLSRLPTFTSLFAGKLASLTAKKEFIFYSLVPALQEHVQNVVRNTNAPHVAVVVLQPSSGRIMAMAGKSDSISTIEFHNDFPAASLFKVVTAAAAIEQAAVTPDTVVRFRGSDYTLSRSNYFPSRHDRREMSVGEALGKSVNPVFGRLALEHLSPQILRRYSSHFGFGITLPFDAELSSSTADIPDDSYELSRTGAGFGNVRLSPVHAAVIMGGLANRGQIQRPYFVEKIVSPTGKLLYRATPQLNRSIVSPHTAKTLLEMMEYTITIGTSRGEFMYRNQPVFPGISVAGKTGTLSGTNPKGLNNWFIATAPVENPQVAIAIITVNAHERNAKASHLGRLILERLYGPAL
jgi:penicillin-binding protein A